MKINSWSEKEKSILRSFYPFGEKEDILKLVNRTWDAIKLQAQSLGLHRTMKQNLLFQRFGRLLVIKEAESEGARKRTRWVCLCDCGKTKDIDRDRLVNKQTRSCGCLRAEVMGDRNRLPDGVAASNELFKRYKADAHKRNLAFELNFEYFLEITKQNCFYCNTSPSQNRGKRKSAYIYNGIDRVDNTKGYLRNNVVTCCKYCNSLKGSLTKEKFDWLIENIYKNYILIKK